VATADPFHEGERYVQERAGEREIALRTGGMLDDEIPPRAIPFLAQQRMVAIGSTDTRGTVSASLLFGARGLVTSPDGQSVVLDLTRVDANRDDPLWDNLNVGADVGLLAIELSSRRRLRINGVVRDADSARVVVTVREAYPNCPKYIQRRHVREDTGASPNEELHVESGTVLDEIRTRAVEWADTFFVASRHPTRGVDVSHRGGAPGFVRVLDASRLRIPDYRGNSMFNTLGNLAANDRAGLVLLDFERSRLVQMTGAAEVQFDQTEDPRQPTGGSGRYWYFHVEQWRELPIATPLRWELLDYSPHNPSALG
jgi:predicted pyridoxine 5'-phosphate oxidase superfamily flavin-nucleotide-binding protein